MLHTKPLYLFDVSPGLIRFMAGFSKLIKPIPAIEIANDRAHGLPARPSPINPENGKEKMDGVSERAG